MNEKQRRLFQRAVESMSLTEDPFVNYKVDIELTGSSHSYDEALYTEEIEVWQKSGGLLLKDESPD